MKVVIFQYKKVLVVRRYNIIVLFLLSLIAIIVRIASVNGQSYSDGDCFKDTNFLCETRSGRDGRFVHLRSNGEFSCREKCIEQDDYENRTYRNWKCGPCSNGILRQRKKCIPELKCETKRGVDGYWVRRLEVIRNGCREMCENFEALDLKLSTNIWECGRCAPGP